MIGFRTATIDDVGTVVALVESAYRGDSSRAGWTTEADLLGGQRTDADAVRAIIDAADADVLLAAEAAGAIVGCCQLVWRGGGICYFGLFAVSPHRQADGIGGRLLGEAERRAVERGAVTMEMTVIAQRLDLIGWYERRGYARTGESRPFPYGDERYGLPQREDLHFVVLAKPLAEE